MKTKKSEFVFPNLLEQPGNTDVRLKVISKKDDLYTVSKLLGHANAKTMQIYAKSAEKLAQLGRELPPRTLL